jgi:hypothetical protein
VFVLAKQPFFEAVCGQIPRKHSESTVAMIAAITLSLLALLGFNSPLAATNELVGRHTSTTNEPRFLSFPLQSKKRSRFQKRDDEWHIPLLGNYSNDAYYMQREDISNFFFMKRRLSEC